MAKKTTLRTPKINEQGEKEYEYIYPQTLADIVHLEDGTSVEEKIIELEENSGVTTDNTTPYQVVDDYNPAHKKYVDTAISQAITGVQLAISIVSVVYAYNLFIEAGYTKEDFIVGVDNQQYLVIEDNEITSVSTEIEFLVIPEGTTSIDDNAFTWNQLKCVVIGDSVATIGAFAFMDNQLTSVVIPDSVTSIGLEAFSWNQLTSVVIPNSVTSIGLGAFQFNQLTSVVIPDSVISISDSAFADNQLTEIIFEGETPPTIESDTFDSNPDLLTQGSIYVPDSAVETYKAATNYVQYADIIKPISERPEEDKVTQEYVDTAISQAITGVLEGEV